MAINAKQQDLEEVMPIYNELKKQEEQSNQTLVYNTQSTMIMSNGT